MATIARNVNTAPAYSRQLRNFAITGLITLFTFLLVIIYLLPLGNMFMLSLRSPEQLAQTQDSPIIPMSDASFNYQGDDYSIYQVPTDSGVKQWALFKKGPQSSQFIDPANPGA